MTIDYIGVVNIHQAPRFSLVKVSGEHVIYYDTPFYDVVRCNVNKDNETFINAEFLELDEALFANLDDIMLQFLGEAEYKPLTLFYDYWKLPKLKTKWTSWLIYSIINLYSKSYKTAVSSNYIADAVPLVVREGVEIDKNELEHIRPEMYSEYSDDEDELLDEIDLEDIV